MQTYHSKNCMTSAAAVVHISNTKMSIFYGKKSKYVNKLGILKHHSIKIDCVQMVDLQLNGCITAPSGVNKLTAFEPRVALHI